MKLEEKIVELKTIIVEELTPLIKNDYVLLDLPYYSNVGDSLIWQGEEDFLNILPYKNLHRASADTFDFRNFGSEIIILMQGGGNFGDIYPKHQIFRKKIAEKYPNNKIIIFPVSIHYSDSSSFLEDAKVLGCHDDLTICVRDKKSLQTLKENFTNNSILLPDMAFCIDIFFLKQFFSQRINDKDLLIKRTDKELSVDSNYENYLNKKNKTVILDWPSKQKGNIEHQIVCKPIHPKTPFKCFANYYALNIYKNYLIRTGVVFISSYNYMYSTRLHGAILSVLLNKPFTFFDNSYGKNKGFYDAWLSDVEDIKFIQS